MPLHKFNWIYLTLLSLVWGSSFSFILVEKGLVGLTALQVGPFRILFAAVFLILVGTKAIREIKKYQ